MLPIPESRHRWPETAGFQQREREMRAPVTRRDHETQRRAVSRREGNFS